jgi:hypothetical protein
MIIAKVLGVEVVWYKLTSEWGLHLYKSGGINLGHLAIEWGNEY